MGVIETEGLSKFYGGRRIPLYRREPVRALEDLSVVVNDGEIFGFLGPNGAGKSTTIRLLLGLIHPSRGSARVLGHDIRTESIQIRRQTGYLPGGIALYDTLSGEQVLDYLGRLYGRGTPLRAELVERLELSRRTLRRLVRDYSRGMRQKIGIIQALQHDPPLAILDEPTEGLDPLMQRAFYDLLEERRSSGRTIFFSSHVLSEVERVCDRVAIIRSGRFVAMSDVNELLARRQRHVEMRVDGAVPELASVPGVSNVQSRDGRVTLQIEGDMAPFLSAIRDVRVTDLTIEPAHLEEAVLEFYADQEPASEERQAAS